MAYILPSFYCISTLLIQVLINSHLNHYNSFATEHTAFCLVHTKSVLPTNCQSDLCIDKPSKQQLCPNIFLFQVLKNKKPTILTLVYKENQVWTRVQSNLSLEPLLLRIVKSVKLTSLNYLSIDNTSLMVLFILAWHFHSFYSVKIQISVQSYIT